MYRIDSTRLDEKQIIEYISSYYDFAYDAFTLIRDDMYQNDWMNCKLDIAVDYVKKENCLVYGQYYSGKVILYLYSIMKKNPINIVPTMIIGVLTHELKHAGQILLPRSSFSSDQEYINAIERSTDWETLQYLTQRRNFLEEYLCVSIDLRMFKNHDLSYPVMPTNVYKPTTPLIYWMDLIGSMFSLYDLPEILSNKKWFDEADNLIIQFENIGEENNMFFSGGQYIKQDGVFTYPGPDTLRLIFNIRASNSSRIAIAGGYDKDNCSILRFRYEILKFIPLLKFSEEEAESV